MPNPKKKRGNPETYLRVVAPCAQCPFKKKSVPGWFGPYTPKHYFDVAMSEAYLQCHMSSLTPEPYHCTGAVLFRANCQKAPRLPPEHKHQLTCVEKFGTSEILNRQEFYEHHVHSEIAKIISAKE